MNAEPRVILQSDWNEAILERKSKAWISFNHEGQKTVNSDIYGINHCESLSKKFEINTKDGFKAQLLSKKKISVEYDDKINRKKVSLKFQAPDVTFSDIHDNQTPVIDMDVGGENIVVSVDSIGVAKIWEGETGTVKRELNGHGIGVCRAKFLSFGHRVITGGLDSLLKLWIVNTGVCNATYTGHRGAITDMATMGIDRNFISTSTDGTAKLWDCENRRCVRTFGDNVSSWNCCTLGLYGRLYGTSFHSSEVANSYKMILVGTESSEIIAFSVRDGQQLFKYNCDSSVNCVLFVNRTLFFAGTEGGYLYIFDIRVPTGPIKMKNEGRGSIKSLCSCDKGIIISTGDGSCYEMNTNFSTVLEYSGSNRNTVYKVFLHETGEQLSRLREAVNQIRMGTIGSLRKEKLIYTCSEDGSIRKYVNNGNE